MTNTDPKARDEELCEQLREAYAASLGSHQDRLYLAEAADRIEALSTPTPPREGEVERVARAIFAAAQAEARRVQPEAPLPSYDEDDETARQFCNEMARAAIAAIHPPERFDAREKARGFWDAFDLTAAQSAELAQALTTAHRAGIAEGLERARQITEELMVSHGNDDANILGVLGIAGTRMTALSPVGEDT